MARRKISIEEALRVLEEAGIPLQPKPLDVVVTAQPQQLVSPAFAKAPPKSPATVRLTLFAKHSVGSGGNLNPVGEGEKAIEDAGIVTYGPGICIVPTALASSLAHADQVAKAADDRMLDRTQRSYLVVERRTPAGYLANVAVEVDSDFYADSPLNWPQGFQHIIK